MDDRVGWCEYGEGEEMVAVLGHLDVVPAGDGWTETEPFSGEIKNGRIYGRGTMDDKGPMVAAIYALAALKQMPAFAPSKRIRRAVRHQRGDRLRRYVVVRFAWRRDCRCTGFTPDGEYPIINGEKGILNGTYSAHAAPDRRLPPDKASRAVPPPTSRPAYAVAELQCPADAACRKSRRTR